MDTLNELSEAACRVIDLTDKVNNEILAEVNSKAPIIVHQRLCGYFMDIMKANSSKVPSDIPKAVEIMTAVKVLEELYPELTTNP